MPKYISAYDLQQREGLTRQQILELAESRPCVWKVPVEGLIIAPEDEKRIDWSKYTPDRQYFIDGLGMLKEHAARDWLYVATAFKRAWNRSGNPDDKLGLDSLLYDRLPRMVSGRNAEALLERMCPQSILGDINRDYPLQSIIDCMDRGRMLNLVLLPRECTTPDHVWMFLCNIQNTACFSQNESNKLSVVIDLFLESFFRERLFFDDATEHTVNVPSSLWAGKTPEAVFDSLDNQNFAPAVIASIIMKQVGGISKTDAGRLFYKDEIDKGIIQENRTYQRKIDSLLAAADEKFTFTFDG